MRRKRRKSKKSEKSEKRRKSTSTQRDEQVVRALPLLSFLLFSSQKEEERECVGMGEWRAVNGEGREVEWEKRGECGEEIGRERERKRGEEEERGWIGS